MCVGCGSTTFFASPRNSLLTLLAVLAEGVNSGQVLPWQYPCQERLAMGPRWPRLCGLLHRNEGIDPNKRAHHRQLSVNTQ